MKEIKDNKRIENYKIVIIILLLLFFFSCIFLINKFGKINIMTTTGNIDIFEIECSNSCKVCDSDEKINNDIPVSNKIIDIDDEITESDSEPESKTDDESDPVSEPEPVVEPEPNELFARDTEGLIGLRELYIFKSPYYVVKGKIAPGSNNTYVFIIKNNNDFSVLCDLKIVETNINSINMKYRLKRDYIYIVDEWKTYDEIKEENILLNSKEMVTYYLEWKWFESSNDTSIGTTSDVEYRLYMEIDATA